MGNVIHHIAPPEIEKWHPVWAKCRSSFQNHFTKWEFKLWTDGDELDKFVTTNYPQYRGMYELFPYHIMRLDFARLCILHHYGGIYADMDYFCYDDFSNYCINSFMIVANNSDAYTSAGYENCLMWCKPNDPFLLELMNFTKTCFIIFRNQLGSKDVLNVNWRNNSKSFAVNNTTGSGMISSAIQQFGQSFDIGYFAAEKFNPPPASWNSKYLGKHVHSSLWGKEYLNHSSRYGVIIRDGEMYNTGVNELKDVISWQDFNFYKDYTIDS